MSSALTDASRSIARNRHALNSATNWALIFGVRTDIFEQLSPETQSESQNERDSGACFMVRIVHRGKTYEVQAGMVVRDAAKKVGLHPESVLATRDGELIHRETILRDGETITLLSVLSGG